MKCSFYNCKETAKVLVEVYWSGEERWFPRCKKHIIKGYEGKIRLITKKELTTCLFCGDYLWGQAHKTLCQDWKKHTKKKVKK